MFGLGKKEAAPLEDSKYAKGKRYQYIKGEKFNNFVEIESFKSPYVNFSDGTRITHEIFDEFLVEPETVDEDFSIEKLKQIPQLQNQHSVQNLNNQSVINLTPNLPIQDKKSQVIMTAESPVTLILQKQNPEEVSFDITIKVRVPDKNLIPILSSSFGDEETTRDLYLYVFSQINFEEFKGDIQLAVQKYYNLKDIKKNTNEEVKADIIQ